MYRGLVCREVLGWIRAEPFQWFGRFSGFGLKGLGHLRALGLRG